MSPGLSDGTGSPSENLNQHRRQRAELRARLAAERAGLLSALLGIETTVLENRPVFGDATAATCLTRVARHESALTSLLHTAASGDRVEHILEDGGGRFEHALAACIEARTRFLDALARVPDHDVFDTPGERTGASSPLSLATQCYWNDASLALRISAWSRQQGLGESVGPVSLLLAAVRAARKEFLSTIALVPVTDRLAASFEGKRSLIDVFRLVTDLESVFLAALSGDAEAEQGRPKEAEDAWTQAWTNLHSTHTALLRTLAGFDQTSIARTLGDRDANQDSVYAWARGCLLHDRLHAAHLRTDLVLDWPERLLR